MNDYLQYPVLFANYADYQNNSNSFGIGLLKGAIDVKVSNKRNDIPLLTMKYSGLDELANELKNDRIILSDAGANYTRQLFRIDKVSKDNVKYVTVEATHIIGDLYYNTIKKDIETTGTPKQCIDALRNNLDEPLPLYGNSDYSDAKAVSWKVTELENAQQTLAGHEGSLLDHWHGEFKFNNYSISFKKTQGEETGFRVNYGHNLIDLQQEDALESVYDAVKSWATFTPETPKEPKPDSSNPTKSDKIKTAEEIAREEVKNYQKQISEEKKVLDETVTNKQARKNLVNQKLIDLAERLSVYLLAKSREFTLENISGLTAQQAYDCAVIRDNIQREYNELQPKIHMGIVSETSAADHIGSELNNLFAILLLQYKGKDNPGNGGSGGTPTPPTPPPEPVTLYLPNSYIKANAGLYEHPRIKAVDLSQYDIKTVDRLVEVTNAYIKDNSIGKPHVNLTIKFEQMQDDLAFLERLDLCDFVTVSFPKIQVNTTAQVIETEWNALLHRYETIMLGDKNVPASNFLIGYVKETSNTINESIDNINDSLNDMDSKVDDVSGSIDNSISELQKETIKSLNDLHYHIDETQEKQKDNYRQIGSDLKNKVRYGTGVPTSGQYGDTYFELLEDGTYRMYTWDVIKGKFVPFEVQATDAVIRKSFEDEKKDTDAAIKAAGFDNAKALYEQVSADKKQIVKVVSNINGIQSTVSAQGESLQNLKVSTDNRITSINSQITQMPNIIDSRITASAKNGEINNRITQSVSNGLSRITLSTNGAGITISTPYSSSTGYVDIMGTVRANRMEVKNMLTDSAWITKAMIQSVDAGTIVGGDIRGIQTVRVNDYYGNSAVLSGAGISTSGTLTVNGWAQFGSNVDVNGSQLTTNQVYARGDIRTLGVFRFGQGAAYLNVDYSTGQLWYNNPYRGAQRVLTQ